MIGKLRRHLIHLLRNPPPESMLDSIYSNGGTAQQQPTPGPYPNQSIGMAPMSATSSSGVAKFDTTPIQSPATTSSWHSPSQIPQASPTLAQDQGYLAAGSGQQLVMTPGGTQKPQQFPTQIMPAMGGPHSHHQRLSDGVNRSDGPPEKRQRLYAPAAGFQT
jgi:osomolarity two-component system response regulator SKN7